MSDELDPPLTDGEREMILLIRREQARRDAEGLGPDAEAGEEDE